ncbi:hypothetical protein C7377_1215 [Balneicella halophila]|uniref:Probable membrane transporter protein n=1 Tax=Balneicella halophila TaxID=1537566 RepID=A0A7L4UQL9_BALHA|nr:sulfite exporter TauE/SafE family protein [Balneicella halophila]PVX50892.1 hypothetical protein C7377_1215 [Balneicella halophila]
MTDWYIYPITVLAGILVGFVNVMAGGGSVLSLPLLMFLGLPAGVANGTNRINILLTSVVGIYTFKKDEKQGAVSLKSSLRFLIPAVSAAIIGAFFAVDIDNELLERIIGILLIIFFFILLYKPKRWLQGNEVLTERKHWWQIPLFFAIGLYGGFIQAGAGIFFLTTLVLGAGFDLLRANLLKLIIILLYTPFVFAIFLYNNQVDWALGISLGIGTVIGAYFGTKAALKRGAIFVRYILLSVIVISAFKFLGLFELLGF